MDKEMIPLCNLLNKFKGIKTTFCCFGHHRLGEFYLCFRCSNIKSLKKILRCFDYFFYNVTIEHDGPDGNPARNNEIAVDVRQNKEHGLLKGIINEDHIKEICKNLRKELKNVK